MAAGAEALVLVNTVLGLGIDVERRRASLGNGGGGVSGPGILPVALRCVYECRAAFPGTAIVGVGGVSSGEDAVAMIVNGFIEPVTRTLPMEYAVEWSRLIELQMEGSVG